MYRRCPTLSAGLLAVATLAASNGSIASQVALATTPTPARTARQEAPRESRLRARLTLPDLVARADLIVAGQVVDLRPSRNPGRSDISTTVVLSVDRPVKGNAGGEVRFRVPGGAVGEDWVWVTHAPRFEIGERALVFLRFSGARLPTVVGMEAGKRSIVADGDGSDRILPELRWNDGQARAPAVLTTVGELADALPQIEIHGRNLRKEE